MASAVRREKAEGIAASSYEEIPCLRDSTLTEALRRHSVVALCFSRGGVLLSNLSCFALLQNSIIHIPVPFLLLSFPHLKMVLMVKFFFFCPSIFDA